MKKTKFKIYQINMARDKDRICFIHYSGLAKFQSSPLVNSSIYDLTYEAEMENIKTLEDIYQIFNLHHPTGFTGRPLSVSDVVQIESSPTIKAGCYFCNDFGFKELTEFVPSAAMR